MLAVPGRGSSAPPEATPGGSARSGRQAGPLGAEPPRRVLKAAKPPKVADATAF